MFSAIKSFAKRNRVLELLGKLQRNGFLQALEAAENNKFDPDCYYTDFENCYSDFCAIFEGLKTYVSEYKVQYIRPLTLAEIAFFEARMSLAKQAKGGIPHIYMKGCN